MRTRSILITATILLGLVPVPAHAAEGADMHAVMSVRQLPNGETEYVSYSPAPGVTGKELFDHLRRKGVTGLVDTHESGGVGVMAGNCRYGTASALEQGTCPAAAWQKSGRTRPLVHFNDHSGWRWRVATGAAKWHRSPKIDVQSAWNSCPWQTVGVHCVDVQSYDFRDPMTGGVTGWRLTVHRYFVEGSVWIRFNDGINSTTNVYDMIVCHEFGHAIGLDHNSDYFRSCMFGDFRMGLTEPAADDYNLLYYVSYPG